VPERFSIAHVTPYAWEAEHEVNRFVARAAEGLHARGHRLLIVAPSESQGRVRDSRRALRAARDHPESLLGAAEEPVVIAAGEVLGPPSTRRRQLPIDVARTIEDALTVATLDFVHVHDPFAPSAASAALRHSRSLNVGSFHAPTERTLSAQVGKRVVELFLGRLDARTASYRATGDLMNRFYPAEYRVISPGADVARRHGREAPLHVVFVAGEERGALRAFLRALRRLDEELPWRATMWSRNGAAVPALRRSLRERVTVAGSDEASEAGVLADADIVVATSSGIAPAPALLGRALAAGAVPVASRLPVYEEVLGEGQYGLLFEPGDALTLVAQLERLIGDEPLRASLADAAEPARAHMAWERVTDELEEVYAGVAGRRHAADGDRGARARLGGRSLIDVDLHMHTDHSPDCAVPVEELLATAKARGLGAIAITDHNEISGAQEARAKADGDVKVIVAEEVKTAHQGEVIGLFIEEKIPRGLSLAETIAEIKRQGGLVYVPHPFDRLHAVPDYEHLLDVLADVDAIEVFNPRVAFKPFNEEAARFAAKYRIVAGAGSDSHVAAGLGSVRIRMRDFDGAEEFLESLRDADIIRKPTSLLYVQALKFLQTKATPAPARDAAKQRRVRRADRRAQAAPARKS
jgi:predicted metal-dependent phosphoesterase TrpH/glycosyltransferase involved in cell wall biosynthesis